jgi:hypothetical protein
MTSCLVTIWDPHWDPRLRMLIHDVLQHQANFAVTAAFENVRTTLEAAKCLTTSSPCLAGFTDHQRMQLVAAIDAADCKGEIFTIFLASSLSAASTFTAQHACEVCCLTSSNQSCCLACAIRFNSDSLSFAST